MIDLINMLNPDEIAVEELFFSRNVKTGIKVAEMRGVILAVLVEMGFAIHEYTPKEVKQAFTGSGNAKKEQVQKMVRLILGRDVRPDDAADAVAIAWCHLQNRKFEELKER